MSKTNQLKKNSLFFPSSVFAALRQAAEKRSLFGFICGWRMPGYFPEDVSLLVVVGLLPLWEQVRKCSVRTKIWVNPGVLEFHLY
jgi:hypothetical protein